MGIYMGEFSMLYDEWTSCKIEKIEKNFTAKELMLLAELKHPQEECKKNYEQFDFLYDKALAVHQKIAMMLYAKNRFIEIKEDFESTQNMNVPAFYGMGKTGLLFYFEGMIIFARNVLDVAAFVYSDLFFDQRIDSFNKFMKKVKESEDPLLEELKQYYIKEEKGETSTLRLLCGSEKGRALRDIIVHQANVHMAYHEYKENSEKEHLFLEVKDVAPIDMDFFMSYFTQDVIDIPEMTNQYCRRKLMSKDMLSCMNKITS